MIYLDYAASSVPFSQAIAVSCGTAMEFYGNPSALHSAGSTARGHLQENRKTLARLLQVRPEEIFFTSGGTESNNWAVRSGCNVPGKKHIICSAAEHSSVLEPVRRLQREGFDVTFLNPDRNGVVSPEAVLSVIRPDTALLCVQAVNNETGVVQDVEALAAVAHSRGVRYLCDAVQSFGHLSLPLHKADLISLSAHKLGGPRGVGCLVIRYPNTLQPLLEGGGQEFSLRSGTENLPGIAGFSLAAELALRDLPQAQYRIQQLSALLEKELRSLDPHIRIAGEAVFRSGILSCAFPNLSAEEMVMRLSLKDICVSPGAACAARSSAPSHVLLSMGYSAKEAAQFVRFSPGWGTTEEEIFKTIDAIRNIYSARR